jgi:hypothetical protein
MTVSIKRKNSSNSKTRSKSRKHLNKSRKTIKTKKMRGGAFKTPGDFGGPPPKPAMSEAFIAKRNIFENPGSGTTSPGPKTIRRPTLNNSSLVSSIKTQITSGNGVGPPQIAVATPTKNLETMMVPAEKSQVFRRIPGPDGTYYNQPI